MLFYCVYWIVKNSVIVFGRNFSHWNIRKVYRWHTVVGIFDYYILIWVKLRILYLFWIRKIWMDSIVVSETIELFSCCAYVCVPYFQKKGKFFYQFCANSLRLDSMCVWHWIIKLSVSFIGVLYKNRFIPSINNKLNKIEGYTSYSITSIYSDCSIICMSSEGDLCMYLLLVIECVQYYFIICRYIWIQHISETSKIPINRHWHPQYI